MTHAQKVCELHDPSVLGFKLPPTEQLLYIRCILLSCEAKEKLGS